MSESNGKISSEIRGIDALLINSFLKVLGSTTRGLTATDVHKGNLTIVSPTVIDGAPLILINVDGEAAGSAIIQMPLETTCRFVSAMLCGTPIETLDELARNSIDELTLRIAENLRTELKGLGYGVYVTAASLYDEPLKIDVPTRLVRIPIATKLGLLNLYINLYRINK